MLGWEVEVGKCPPPALRTWVYNEGGIASGEYTSDPMSCGELVSYLSIYYSAWYVVGTNIYYFLFFMVGSVTDFAFREDSSQMLPKFWH